MYNIHPLYYLGKYFISKIDFPSIEGHKLSHISEMSPAFITNSNNMTYEYYLKQPKSMQEWKLIEKLARIPELIKTFNVTTVSHPLIRKYLNIHVINQFNQ